VDVVRLDYVVPGGLAGTVENEDAVMRHVRDKKTLNDTGFTRSI
jgi:hypothetical protein